MSGLSETLAGLSAIKRAMASSSEDPIGMMNEVSSFGPNPGALRMLCYAPQHLPATSPLVVALHGCTQSAAGYASSAGWLTLADRLGFAVLAPEQTSANNPNRCFNWFEVGDTKRGKGEAASIHAMIMHMIASHSLDAKRVFITGLSAGGAMTAAMLAEYPEIFAAGAVIAGLPAGAADSVQTALAVMRTGDRCSDAALTARIHTGESCTAYPRLSIWHGTADRTVSDANADDLQRQWTGLLGLPQAPNRTEVAGRWTRSQWVDDTGEVLVERHSISGLGHGAPLALSCSNPVGHVAPFMLDAGVSSSLEIAQFWGIAAASGDGLQSRGSRIQNRRPHGDALGESVMAAVGSHVQGEVGTVIAKALKAAGLLR